MRRARSLSALTVLLAGCSTDFTIAKSDEIIVVDTGGEDTDAQPADEGGAPVDTAEPAPDDAGGSGTTEADGGGTTDGGTTDGGTTGGGTTGGGTTDGGDPVEPDPVEPPPEDDCAGVEDQIYLIDKDTQHLFLFNPATLGLTDLGGLDCDPWSEPASMAVARDGRAFVRYSDNSVWEVDLTTLMCMSTSYTDRSTGFGAFGMGYATDDPTTWRDQLYIANSRQLATLDTATMRVTSFSTLPSQAELTGNADGELWAFLPLESPVELRRIDQSSGAVLETLRVSGFPSPTDIDTFAFAAWGGELWAFVRRYGMGSSTDVYQIDATGRMTVVATRIGINAVGAGVSTCASTD